MSRERVLVVVEIVDRLAKARDAGAECLVRAAVPQSDEESRSLKAFTPALILLVLCLIINYVDRGNLSVAAPLLKGELHLANSQPGILFSAFFVTYTAMQFVVGWLVDRFDANHILAAGFVLWSLATIVTGVVWGFALLFLIRLILGIGESVALPCSSKILARNLSEYHRGFASGAIKSALRCGNAVGTFGAGFLMDKLGWRPVFIGVGIISLLWLPAWLKWMPRGDKAVDQTRCRGIGFEYFASHFTREHQLRWVRLG